MSNFFFKCRTVLLNENELKFWQRHFSWPLARLQQEIMDVFFPLLKEHTGLRMKC